MSHNLSWMLITASPSIAQYAEKCGVHRIFLDMETLGKHERQKHLAAHSAAHTYEDIVAISTALQKAEILVRVNPLYEHTLYEVDRAIESGAQRLMLPMYRYPEEVCKFLKLVDNRVPVTFLAETIQAVSRLSTYIPYLGDRDEVHFGLNDLSLDMGLNYLFEPLAARTFEYGTRLLIDHNIRFGFGGISRLGHGELSSEWVLGEHVRLGSSWVILSRAFHQNSRTVEELTSNINLEEELSKLRKSEEAYSNGSNYLLELNRLNLEKRIFDIAKEKRLYD